MYFCSYFVLSNAWSTLWSYLHNTKIWGHFWSTFGYLPPPMVTIYRVTPTVLQFILNKYHHALYWMYFCGYFALSNAQNCEVICIIPIFGVIFGQNLGIWPPGVTIYRVTPHCFAINFEEIPSCFVLNVFLWLLCIIKCSKLQIYLHNSNIWPHFWSIFGYLTPGVTIYRGTPHTVLQLILKKYHDHALCWMYFCGYFALANAPNCDVICILPIFGVIFRQNLGIWPPGVTIYRVSLLCFAIHFE
jgi:hypothetical protein